MRNGRRWNQPSSFGQHFAWGRAQCGRMDSERESTVRTTEGSSKWTYVGACRCGRGPNAYYQDTEGNLIHASGLRRGMPAQNSGTEKK